MPNAMSNALISGDDPSWSQPPKIHTTKDPLYVDFRFNIWQIANVDTVAGTADVKVGYHQTLNPFIFLRVSSNSLSLSFKT